MKLAVINNAHGFVGGVAGTSIGAYIGGLLGILCVGPAGAILGASVGAFVGGLLGGIGCSIAAEYCFKNKNVIYKYEGLEDTKKN